jgi:three-Cys-motif partner protein
MFSMGMKNAWQCRVYLDLYSGAGRAKIKGTKKFVDTSALLAIKTNPQFSKYIFCDLNGQKLGALRERVSKLVPGANVSYIEGDSSETCEVIKREIPAHSREYRVLSFCVIDPFNTSNFSFDIINSFRDKIMDFLVLIPSGMDVGRNMGYYYEQGNDSLERFLGDPEWRNKWNTFQEVPRNNADFVVESFCDKMTGLGYKDSRQFLKKVKIPGKNVLLYHLAFFSKSDTGLSFWKESLKRTAEQTSFLDEF